MPLLDIKDIIYTVSGRDTVSLINRLSLAIESGEVHTLIGTNGTGKSTLAYLIMGCEGYRPTDGEIRFEGMPTPGMRGVRGMLGSVARNVLGHSECSVLIYKAKQV